MLQPKEPLRLAIAKAIALVLNRDMYERTESNISADVAESFSKAFNVKISSETLIEKAKIVNHDSITNPLGSIWITFIQSIDRR